MNNQKPLNFFLVLCKNRKKFDKYVKINKIRKMHCIDIKKMCIEEGVSGAEAKTSDSFKLIVLKRFHLAIEKKKNIYYIPNFDADSNQFNKYFNIKSIVEESHNFNLIFFHEDFTSGEAESLLDRIAEFSTSQILERY